MRATLLLTRPFEQSLETAKRCEGLSANIVVSSLIEIVPTADMPETPADSSFVVTSQNGARRLPETQEGIVVFCVGDRTAQIASELGYVTKSAKGDVDDLLSLINRRDEIGPLVHVRGVHTSGDLVAKLSAQGHQASEWIAYDQREQPLSADAKLALNGKKPIILPLFSPRTASLLLAQGPFSAPIHPIGMSQAVLDALGSMQTHPPRVAARPTADAMLTEIEALLSQPHRLESGSVSG